MGHTETKATGWVQRAEGNYTLDTEDGWGASLHINAAATDNRRARKYGRGGVLYVKMPVGTEANKHPRESGAPRVEKAMKDVGTMLSTALPALKVESTYFDDYRLRQLDEKPAVSLTFFMRAGRPSDTLPRDKVHEVLDAASAFDSARTARTARTAEVVDGALAHYAIEKVKAVLAAQELAKEVDARRKTAARLGAELAKEADKRARKATRFKQRLAALVAELKAEQQEQLAEVLDDEEVAAELADYNADAAAVAREVAGKYMPEASPGRFGFGSYADALSWDLYHETLARVRPEGS